MTVNDITQRKGKKTTVVTVVTYSVVVTVVTVNSAVKLEPRAGVL
jgi:hypothetical protein